LRNRNAESKKKKRNVIWVTALRSKKKMNFIKKPHLQEWSFLGGRRGGIFYGPSIMILYVFVEIHCRKRLSAEQKQ